MPKKKNLSLRLLTDLFFKETDLKAVIRFIDVTNGGSRLWTPDSQAETSEEEYTFISIKNVPDYFQLGYKPKNTLKCSIFPSVKGYAIFMKDFKGVDDYVKSQFSTKARGNLSRALRRLEHCYDISYQQYHGTLEKQEYNTLMSRLREMIIKRFKERGEENDALKNWDAIEKTTYDLILEKKASLAVIKHGDAPIAIALSYHYNSVFFYYIPSYDIDYGKFSLGNIMIFKQLEWCFKNGHQYFEMGWGDLDYKRRWSNYIYNCEHHLLYSKNSVKYRINALIEGNKTSLIAYLISKNVNKTYKNIKAYISLKKREDHLTYNYNLSAVEPTAIPENLVEIALESPTSFPLKMALNDFCYTYEERFSNLKLFKLETEDSYLLRGEKKSARLVFAKDL